MPYGEGTALRIGRDLEGRVAGEDQAIDELEAELRAVDPVAVANPGSYRPVILEQLRDELF